MCNLNIILKKKGNGVEAIEIERVTTASYIHNYDAAGVYFNGNDLLEKTVAKINYIERAGEIQSSEVIITHQRIATNGEVTDENAQPFQSKRWVLAHNGILYSDLINEKESDSKRFFTSLIDKGLPNSKRVTVTTTKVKKVIERAFKRFSGSFSIALYDKIQNKLYYFKSSGTQINCWRLGSGFYLATSRDGSTVLERLGEEYDMQAERIYEFSYSKKGWKLRDAGAFKGSEDETETYYGSPVKRWNAGTQNELDKREFHSKYPPLNEIKNLWEKEYNYDY